VGHATGQLRHFRHEDLIFLAPVDDELVFVHQSSNSGTILPSTRLYFAIA
jgi:hypothetical protein